MKCGFTVYHFLDPQFGVEKMLTLKLLVGNERKEEAEGVKIRIKLICSN